MNLNAAHILNGQQTPPAVEFPKHKVLAVHVLLSGKVYYVPGGRVSVVPQIVEIPVCYSEVKLKDDRFTTMRHDEVQIVGAGVIFELVDKPTWWKSDYDQK